MLFLLEFVFEFKGVLVAMKKKIKIVVDSGCDLSNEIKKNNNIVSVPFNLILDDKNFVDDEKLDTKKFLNYMHTAKTCKTAAASPEQFKKEFKGDEDIFVVTISSKLSGSYNSAKTALQNYFDEAGEKFIYIFDSLSASVGETLTALKISELYKLNFDKQKIISEVEDFIKNLSTYFILERFDNFVKNGRINPYIAKLASFFNIKPICKGKNGIPVLAEKAQGFDNALNKLVNIICKNVIEPEKKILGITHVQCLQRAIDFKNKIKEKINFRDIIILSATGLCSTYADQNGIIMAF